MMTGDFVTGYAEDEYMQMVSLPMNGGAMELKLILPREGGAQAFDEPSRSTRTPGLRRRRPRPTPCT